MSLQLTGYRYSVYTRIVRAALLYKDVLHQFTDLNPFDEHDAARNPHPFNRVPVILNDGIEIYETQAILRYVDRTWPAPTLRPDNPIAAARADQVVSIIDNYAYWPWVRQVFAHRVFRPAEGMVPDESEIEAGLAAAEKPLSALEMIATEGLVLKSGEITLADVYLAPMMDYFTQAPEGRSVLAKYPSLSAWWADAQAYPFMVETTPGLPA